MKIEKIPLVYVLFAILLLFAIGAGAFYATVCKPRLEEVKKLSADVDAEKLKTQQAREKVKQLPVLQLRQATLMQQIAEMVDKELDATKTIPLTILQSSKFFKLLLDFLDGAPGVQVDGLSYSKNGVSFSLGAGGTGGTIVAPQAGSGGYAWVPTPLPLSITVKDYETLSNYIKYVGNFPLLLSVDRVSISPGGAAAGGTPQPGRPQVEERQGGLSVKLPLTMYQLKKVEAAAAAPQPSPDMPPEGMPPSDMPPADAPPM